MGAGSLWQDGSEFNCTHEIQSTCYTLCKLKVHPWLWNLEDFKLLGKKKEGDSVGLTMKVKRIALIKGLLDDLCPSNLHQFSRYHQHLTKQSYPF